MPVRAGTESCCVQQGMLSFCNTVSIHAVEGHHTLGLPKARMRGCSLPNASSTEPAASTTIRWRAALRRCRRDGGTCIPSKKGQTPGITTHIDTYWGVLHPKSIRSSHQPISPSAHPCAAPLPPQAVAATATASATRALLRAAPADVHCAMGVLCMARTYQVEFRHNSRLLACLQANHCRTAIAAASKARWQGHPSLGDGPRAAASTRSSAGSSVPTNEINVPCRRVHPILMCNAGGLAFLHRRRVHCSNCLSAAQQPWRGMSWFKGKRQSTVTVARHMNNIADAALRFAPALSQLGLVNWRCSSLTPSIPQDCSHKQTHGAWNGKPHYTITH